MREIMQICGGGDLSAVYDVVTGRIKDGGLIQSAVSTGWETTSYLRLVLEKVRVKRPRSRILLHYDNASPHTAKQITNHFATLDIEILAHPPYSPDLASRNLYLFPKIKGKVQGKWFADAAEAVAAYEKVVGPKRPLGASGQSVSLSGSIECSDVFVDLNGNYFEK
ncbi:Histone-lysine N-methyltransferase SETMAR [Eumeta japonica]|uniref:Histone-lysine N-methyltransferase SETMAR n=1 Tax=Eumeta variegata TaxID=151549 RepID=A0A4C1T283_EUMVA|nr:Histone-lysine N-methyltransferase SETMAR [Eumeta japonica]